MRRSTSLMLLLPLTAALAGMMAAPNREEPKPKVVIVKAVDVSATEYKWSPALITVNPGDTVRFEQTAAMPHNVEFRDVPASAKIGDIKMGPFLTAPGETYDVVIDGRFTAGKYDYVCTPHEALGLTGTITVGGK